MVLLDTVVLLSSDKYIMILSHKWGFCSKYYLLYVILSEGSFFYYFRTGIALSGREISTGQYEEMIILE